MGDDLSRNVSFPTGAGQLPNNASGAEQGKEQPQYITKEELSRSLESLRTELERRTQSMNDQASARIEKRVAQRLTEIDNAAKMFGADPAAIEAAKQRVVMEELQRVPDAQPAQQPAPAAPQTPQQSDDRVAYANANAARLVRKYGVNLTEAEVQSLPSDDPDTWLDALEDVLKAKQALGQIPSAARIPSSGVSGLPLDKTSMTVELENLLAHPKPENLARIRELREKLKH